MKKEHISEILNSPITVAAFFIFIAFCIFLYIYRYKSKLNMLKEVIRNGGFLYTAQNNASSKYVADGKGRGYHIGDEEMYKELYRFERQMEESKTKNT